MQNCSTRAVLQRCACVALLLLLLLLHCSAAAAAAAPLLLHCCCTATAILLLLLLCCTAAAALLLHSYSTTAAAVVQLLHCCCRANVSLSRTPSAFHFAVRCTAAGAPMLAHCCCCCCCCCTAAAAAPLLHCSVAAAAAVAAAQPLLQQPGAGRASVTFNAVRPPVAPAPAGKVPSPSRTALHSAAQSVQNGSSSRPLFRVLLAFCNLRLTATLSDHSSETARGNARGAQIAPLPTARRNCRRGRHA